jgi:hypothetical protein
MKKKGGPLSFVAANHRHTISRGCHFFSFALTGVSSLQRTKPTPPSFVLAGLLARFSNYWPGSFTQQLASNYGT